VRLAVLPALHVLLSKSAASVQATGIDGGVGRLEGVIPSAGCNPSANNWPGLSSGAGVMETGFDHHEPLIAMPPKRARVGANPFDRSEYLARLR